MPYTTFQTSKQLLIIICLLLSNLCLFSVQADTFDTPSEDPLNIYETAIALEDIGDYESATQYYLNAIKLYLTYDKEKSIVPICERLAHLSLFMGEYKLAAIYINSAYLIVESHDPSKAAHLLTYLEQVCLEGELSKKDLFQLSHVPSTPMNENLHHKQYILPVMQCDK